jgi:hypothetical protein
MAKHEARCPRAAGSGDTEPLAPPRRTGCAVARRPVRRVQNAPLGADVLLPFATCSLPATSLPAMPQCLIVDIGGSVPLLVILPGASRGCQHKCRGLRRRNPAPTLRLPARLTTLPFGFNCATNTPHYV